MSVRVKAAQVLETLGYIPAGMGAIMKVRGYDLVVHHRRRTIKNAANWPGGRQAQKMVAANFRRYSRLDRETTAGAGAFKVVAESFMRIRTDPNLRDVDDLFVNLEQGGTLTSKSAMLIPVGKGLTTRRWSQLIASRQLTLIPRPGKAPLLIKFIGPRRSGKGEGFGGNAELYGVLARSRRQRPLLGFFDTFNSVLPLHLRKMDQSLDRMLTEAGRAANAKELWSLGGGTEDTFARRQRKYGYAGEGAFAKKMEGIEKRDSIAGGGA